MGAEGLGRVVGVGRALTLALVVWLMFVAYLLLRRYGGPGSEKLAAAAVALFGARNMPFVYWSVNWWRTMHPKTTVVPTLGPSDARRRSGSVSGVHAADGADRRCASRLERQRRARRRAVLELED